MERWGEEVEVAMDVDVSEADMAAIKAVRENLPSSSNLNLGAFGVPCDYTNDYSVSGNNCFFSLCKFRRFWSERSYCMIMISVYLKDTIVCRYSI